MTKSWPGQLIASCVNIVYQIKTYMNESQQLNNYQVANTQ